MDRKSNLKTYILDEIDTIVGKKFVKNTYFDICDEEYLTTDKNATDIISHQLELVFEKSQPIYISWATISGWFQYSICISQLPFCKGVPNFTKNDDNWNYIIGQKLISYRVYGYFENRVKTIDSEFRQIIDTYYDEPHLIVFLFENEAELGVANFYLEKNFIPKFPMGDDIWITFDKTQTSKYIEVLKLDLLN